MLRIQIFTARIFVIPPHLLFRSGDVSSLSSGCSHFFYFSFTTLQALVFLHKNRIYLTHSANSVCRFFISFSNNLDKWMRARSVNFSIFWLNVAIFGGFPHYDKFSNLCYSHIKTDLSYWSHPRLLNKWKNVNCVHRIYSVVHGINVL